MNKFKKNSYLFIILLILLISKNYLYSLFIPKNEYNIENNEINLLKKELNDLKKINEINYDNNITYGKVLYQNPYKFNEELVIITNTDNIHKNDYVISYNGLIGIVDKIYQNKIIVKMLTSKDIMLQIKINDCYGILKYKDNKYIISNIDKSCNVNVNDQVYTSNIGYINNEILIGNVIDIIKDKNDISDDYIIKYSNNFNYLNNVIIISKV